jgi:hypothetical protein
LHEQNKERFADYSSLVNCDFSGIPGISEIQNFISLKMVTMFAAILFLIGFLCFVLFFKAIDFFDKI